jgi:hypothetical protein
MHPSGIQTKPPNSQFNPSSNPPTQLTASLKSYAEAGSARECEISALPVSWDQTSAAEALPDQPLSSSSPTDRPGLCVFDSDWPYECPMDQLWRWPLLLSIDSHNSTPGPPKGPPPSPLGALGPFQLPFLNCHSWEPRNGVGSN